MTQNWVTLFLFLFYTITGCTFQSSPQGRTPGLSTRQANTPVLTVIPNNQEKSGVKEAQVYPETPVLATSTSQNTPVTPEKTASIIQSSVTPTQFIQKPESIDWQSLPVIPIPGEAPRLIYQHGLESGNSPQAFSKIGDCGSTPAWFLGDFDRSSKYYRLGPYQFLEKVIQEFQGSYDRTSLAAKSGFNASSVFTPLWANREKCNPNESPLACEYRLHRPVIAFIMLGTNDVHHQDTFEAQMRKIIEFSIENGMVPILSTKADNIEGDGSINATIARLAIEYDIPLWNFWLAVQSLPDHGLQSDQAHITWGPNRFDDPAAMTKAWPIRNLTALQTLDVVWRNITGQEQPAIPTSNP